MNPVTLKISWEDLFAIEARDMSAAVRRQRWAQWLRLAKANGEEWLLAFYRGDLSACNGCIHRRGSWCTLQALPCVVNPILTVRHSMPGMACMGVGYEQR